MRLIFAVVLGTVPFTASASDDLVACVQENIRIEAAMAERFPSATAALTVTNGLSYAVSSLHYQIVVTETGRSVPWVKTDVGLNIAGGIEPGETRTLRTYIPSFSHSAGEHLSVDVTVLDAADADKVSIAGASMFQGWERGPSPKGCP